MWEKFTWKGGEGWDYIFFFKNLFWLTFLLPFWVQFKFWFGMKIFHTFWQALNGLLTLIHLKISSIDVCAFLIWYWIHRLLTAWRKSDRSFSCSMLPLFFAICTRYFTSLHFYYVILLFNLAIGTITSPILWIFIADEF